VSLRAPPADRRAAGASVSPLLFGGLAVASVGGPLALVALYVPALVDDVRASAGLVALLAVAAFAAPTLVWWRYSADVASPGGLYSFTAAAAGRRVAAVQAGLWVLSYLLYLLYTVDYVVYDLLPAAVPAAEPYRPVLELTVPLLIAAVVLAPLRVGAGVLTVLAAAQVVLVGTLAAVLIGHTGAPVGSLAPHGPARPLLSGVGEVSLLFVCASLPVFFGGEVTGGGRTVRRAVAAAVGLTGAGLVLTMLPLARIGGAAGQEIPGMALARTYAGHGLALAVGLGVVASILGLVVVEYLALARLGHALTGSPIRTVAGWLLVPFLAANAVSLADPDRFYDVLLRPSLVALWLSQLVVVAVYPRFAALRHRLRRSDVLASAVASALMLYGLYLSVAGSAGT
jgi:hypothetical protein